MRIKESSNTIMDLRPLKDATTPLISIITPAYNSEKYITAAIDSVLTQTYRNWELLLVMDAKSSDKTLEIATDASKRDARIKVIQDPTCISLSANRNRGLDLAEGALIAFLDSDDKWLPTKLATQVSTMLEHKLDLSYHSFKVIDENGFRCGPTRHAKYDVGYSDLLKNNCIGCLTVMVTKEFIGSKRMYNIRHEDLHFWLQLLTEGGNAYAIPKPLAEYRIRKNSVSDNKLQCAVWRWKLYRHLNIPMLRSIQYMALYILFAINKRL